jgi:hypothetical protein
MNKNRVGDITAMLGADHWQSYRVNLNTPQPLRFSIENYDGKSLLTSVSAA